MHTDIETRGGVTLKRECPPSTLAGLTSAIVKVLGKPLPPEVAAFYATSNGMRYTAARDGESLGLDESLSGLDRMFHGFMAHRQLADEEAFADFARGDIYEAPHGGTIWSEDFSVEQEGDLARFNQMLRAKLLISVAGQPDAIAIDFAPTSKEGAARGYELLLVHEGNDVLPLALDFPTFVKHFERFGSAGWPYAFVGKQGGEVLNIDLAEAVQSALAPLAPEFADEIAALVAQARE